MKLYKTTADAPSEDSGKKTSWAGSLADASKQRAAMKKEGLKDVSTDDVEVPTSKAGLLEWLNSGAAA